MESPPQSPLTGVSSGAPVSKDNAALDIPALPVHPVVHPVLAAHSTSAEALPATDVVMASPEDAFKYENLGRDPDRLTRSRLSLVATVLVGSLSGGGAVYLLLFAPSAPLSLLGGLFLLGISAVILSPLLKQASTGELEEMLTSTEEDLEDAPLRVGNHDEAADTSLSPPSDHQPPSRLS